MLDGLTTSDLGQLAPEVADRHPHGVGERVGVLVPDVLEQALGAVDLVRVEQEEAEERELLGRQVEGVTVDRGDVPGRVELDVVPAQDRAGAGGLTAEQRPHASGELAERERLHEVVVSPVVEAGDAILHSIPSRQHQDAGSIRSGELGPRGVSDVTADLEAVQVGQVQVQADHVVGVHVQPVERGPSVAGHVDGIALSPKAGRHGTR